MARKRAEPLQEEEDDDNQEEEEEEEEDGEPICTYMYDYARQYPSSLSRDGEAFPGA